ncbi:MAG: DUF262 domain-containing protein [Stellaceae bacterium]
MPSNAEMTFKPLVVNPTLTQSVNVSAVIQQLSQGILFVPDYQRDSSQWDIYKRSLFIESLVNNMTVPPLVVYPQTSAAGLQTQEIVDGQQRLTTIRDYLNNRFQLASDDAVEYSENTGSLLQGKQFSDLPQSIQNQINFYILNFIILPANLELGLRLEIFRRINEGGEPLSPQDLRLAVFGESDRVYFIRLVGVFDPQREGAARMIKAGREKYELEYPWKDPQAWNDWWKESGFSAGQAPSQMFLYYVISRDTRSLGELLASEQAQRRLGRKYNRTTISVLDIYTAQLQYESKSTKAAHMLASLSTMKKWFEQFELWFNHIKMAKVPQIGTNSATKIALFIAAATEMWGDPKRRFP